MAKFFVCTKSNWQGDNWSVAAGPFATRADAQAEAEKLEQHPRTSWGGGIDLKEEVHSTVKTRTELVGMGYKNNSEGEYAILEAIISARENNVGV